MKIRYAIKPRNATVLAELLECGDKLIKQGKARNTQTSAYRSENCGTVGAFRAGCKYDAHRGMALVHESRGSNDRRDLGDYTKSKAGVICTDFCTKEGQDLILSLVS